MGPHTIVTPFRDVKGRVPSRPPTHREPNPRAMMGLNLVVTAFGVRINYSEKSLQ